MKDHKNEEIPHEEILEKKDEHAVLEMDEHTVQTHESETGHAESDGHGEIIHEHTLFAEPILNFGNFSITNSLLNSWIAVFIIATISILIGKKIS